jgi:hypothetical protein
MKKTLSAAAVAAITILLVACGAGAPTATIAPASTGAAPTAVSATPAQTAKPAGPGFEAAPWADGESASYDVLSASSQKIGTSESGLTLDTGAWVLSWSDKIGELDQSWKLRMDAQTLKPLSEEKTIHTAATDATISTTYTGSKLDIKAIVKGETQSASMNVPDNAIDNDQLLVVLRALPFAQGYEAKYAIIVAQNALNVPVTIRVKAKESVEVPAGKFEAWRVELDFGQGQQSLWYQVDSPHRLVQYDNGATKMVLTK